jgi:diaminopimelate dehydrogenase
MSQKVNLAVIGAGAVGLGTLDAILKRGELYGDVNCVAMATRRPEDVAHQLSQDGIGVPVVDYDTLRKMNGIDVAVLADASQRLFTQAPSWLEFFNTTDSCDFHDRFGPFTDGEGVNHQGFIRDMADAAEKHDRLASVGFGWDPGSIFSYSKLRGESVFPGSVTNVFYGPGKSQGHTTALKTPEMRELGVIDAIQFTMPHEATIARAKGGEMKIFSAGERMWRDCYLLVGADADRELIEQTIDNMPGYFADYNVKVSFVTEGELRELQKRVSHQGTIITTGKTRRGNSVVEEFVCNYESNAEATGCLLTDAAIATARAYEAGERGIILPGEDIRNLSSPLSRLEIIQRGF